MVLASVDSTITAGFSLFHLPSSVLRVYIFTLAFPCGIMASIGISVGVGLEEPHL